MNILIVLIPVSVCLGAAGLAACLWTLRSGQYDDLEGDAARILLENGETPDGKDRERNAEKTA
ncbi:MULTISPECIES: cbb3-type cytochrome oxidase assembly protein CcoS [unclassified Sulfitobacter]|uniref:cbb3-type cytochrome oxidase assembly protein CcoS n=1 Tax=unclassified Sulfitobacter TaxID=196795 RepID=UPI003745F666